MKNLATIEEAAEHLRCSQTHIKRMINAGKLSVIDIGLGSQQILRVELPEAAPKNKPKPRRRKYVPKILKR
ncbi:MAG TPA: hypothetical protein DDW52_20240 [Planctomycetaceae bacterium]|nr:hypothetical protein [Planctomycetaceae bacterium]